MDIDLKKRRRELGLTLEKIGDYVGVSKTTVRRWEIGDIQNMRRDKIQKYAEILKVSPSVFIGSEEEKPATREGDRLSEDIKEINEIWGQLGAEERKALLQFARFQKNEQDSEQNR